MIKLDEKTALKRVYDPYTEDIQYKELSAEFIKLIEKNPDYLKIESIESAIEAKIADITYSKRNNLIIKAERGQIEQK